MNLITKQQFPLRFFMLIRLLIGHYHEISSSRIFCLVLRIYCLMFCCMTTACIASYLEYDIIFPTILMTDLATAFVLSYITKQTYFFEYIQNIEKINALMRIYKSNFLSCVGLTILLSSLLLKITTFPIGIAMGFDYSILITFGVDINFCVFLFIISTFHEKMKKLRQLYKKQYKFSKLISRDNSSKTVRDLFRYLAVYDSLIENFTHIDIKLQFIVTNIIIFRWLETYGYMMVSINSYAVLETKLRPFGRTFFCGSLILIDILQASSPALLMQLATNEVTEIRKIIARQLDKTGEPCVSSVLRRSLRYMGERPPRLALWRAVTVDARLLPAMLALLLTYSVVAMQFMGVGRIYEANSTDCNNTGSFNRYR